jgi:hypothetical protein
VSYIGKGFATAFVVADMRLLSRVRSGMYRQCAPLDEALMTVLVGTLVRSLVGMYTIVPAKI